MKKYLSMAVFAACIMVDSAYSEESSGTVKKIFGSVLIAGGVAGLAYEGRKNIETEDSSQTKLLSALSIAGGIVLFRSASNNTAVNVTSQHGAPLVGLNYRF